MHYKPASFIGRFFYAEIVIPIAFMYVCRTQTNYLCKLVL